MTGLADDLKAAIRDSTLILVPGPGMVKINTWADLVQWDRKSPAILSPRMGELFIEHGGEVQS